MNVVIPLTYWPLWSFVDKKFVESLLVRTRKLAAYSAAAIGKFLQLLLLFSLSSLFASDRDWLSQLFFCKAARIAISSRKREREKERLLSARKELRRLL